MIGVGGGRTTPTTPLATNLKRLSGDPYRVQCGAWRTRGRRGAGAECRAAHRVARQHGGASLPHVTRLLRRATPRSVAWSPPTSPGRRRVSASGRVGVGEGNRRAGGPHGLAHLHVPSHVSYHANQPGSVSPRLWTPRVGWRQVNRAGPMRGRGGCGLRSYHRVCRAVSLCALRVAHGPSPPKALGLLPTP